MDFVLIGFGVFFLTSLVEFIVILHSRSDVFTNLYLAFFKKKGAKKIIFLHPDRTFNAIARIVEPGATKVKLADTDYLIDEKAIMYDRDRGVQGLLVKEGQQEVFNPFSEKDEGINPEFFKATIMAYYNLGKKEGSKESDFLMKLLKIAVAAAVVAALFSFLNFQTLGTLISNVQSLGVSLG